MVSWVAAGFMKLRMCGKHALPFHLSDGVCVCVGERKRELEVWRRTHGPDCQTVELWMWFDRREHNNSRNPTETTSLLLTLLQYTRARLNFTPKDKMWKMRPKVFTFRRYRSSEIRASELIYLNVIILM